MKVVLYTIDCPKCLVLEKKLTNKKIQFNSIKDKDLMIELGFTEVPMLRVVSGDNSSFVDMGFTEAVQWIEKQ